MTYTTHKATDVSGELASFYIDEAENVSKLFGDKFNFKNFQFISYVRKNLVWVCKKDDRIVGLMMARLYGSIFDPETKILFQDLLYVKAGAPKAAYLLLKCFLDFGKSNADHIFTSTTDKTNIKGQSLERLGFKKIQEQYRLEVSK